MSKEACIPTDIRVKETYLYVKRGLHTHGYLRKRDLLTCQKRPAYLMAAECRTLGLHIHGYPHKETYLYVKRGLHT
jgi:hypothetical protein